MCTKFLGDGLCCGVDPEWAYQEYERAQAEALEAEAMALAAEAEAEYGRMLEEEWNGMLLRAARYEGS